jgi:replicative DNA helicase
MGKTAFAMNIAEHVALEAGKSVAVYSFERSAEQLVLRPLCALARVEMQKIRQGFLNKMDVTTWCPTNRIAESKPSIDDTPSLSILEFQANARRLKTR